MTNAYNVCLGCMWTGLENVKALMKIVRSITEPQESVSVVIMVSCFLRKAKHAQLSTEMIQSVKSRENLQDA